jgi:hypothetical protein
MVIPQMGAALDGGSTQGLLSKPGRALFGTPESETVVQPKDRIFLCGAQTDIKKAARILRRESLPSRRES